MGFMDKVKSAAQDAATQAKKATSQAQTKMEEGQVRKKLDETAKNLGYLIYRERSQGTPAGAQADSYVSEMQGLEAQISQLQAQAAAEAPQEAPPVGEQQGSTAPAGAGPEPTPSAPPPSTSSSEPTGGDFKL